jgi:regulator of protease activity HflC (stomatin/prohibitin superfamily)
MGFRRVPDNSVVTVHRFGRFVRALGAGWRWTVPGLDQLGQPICLIGHYLDIPDATGAHAELYYQILDPAQAGEALDRVDALVTDQARAALASLDGSPRPLAEALKAELNRRIGSLGLRVIRCSLHTA